MILHPPTDKQGSAFASFAICALCILSIWAEGDDAHQGEILDASGKTVTPDDLTKLIQNVKGYQPGQTVIIMACYGGHTPDSIAERDDQQ